MHTLQINGATYQGPENWDQLKRENLLQLARLQPQLAAKAQARYLLICYLFAVPLDRFVKLSEALLIQCEELITWLYQKNTLSKWLLPQVRGFYGPQSRLANLTAEEFSYAEAAYEAYVETEKEVFLHELFAYLYRRKDWWSDKRPIFDARKQEKRVKQSKNVPLYIKRAVLLNYVGCRNYIIQLHPFIWKKPDEGSSDAAGSKYTPWGKIFMNLAGDKFGTYEQTLKTDVWLVLADMEMKAKQVAEMEAKK